MLNKPRKFLLVLIIAVFLVPVCASASVLEKTGFIFGYSGESYSFVADQTPLVYKVTLTDFEFPAAFDSLSVAITTSTDMVAELLEPGMTTFNVDLGTTYFANVLGNDADPQGAGLFGLEIASIPIPSAVWLLGSGLFCIVGIRRKFKK